jgi:hypothetical protein
MPSPRVDASIAARQLACISTSKKLWSRYVIIDYMILCIICEYLYVYLFVLFNAYTQGDVLLEWDYSKGQPNVPLVKDTFASERRKAKTLNFSIGMHISIRLLLYFML